MLEQVGGVLLPALGAVQLGDVLEVLPHGEVVVEHRLVAEVAGERPGVERTGGVAEHRHRPGGGVEQAGGEAQQRRLAAAVVPEQHDPLAGGDVEVDRAERRSVAVASWSARRRAAALMHGLAARLR